MSGSTAVDVRLPIGGLFTALGVLLSGYGAATAGNTPHYARSLSVNINLWWGLVMLAFVSSCYWLPRSVGANSPRVRVAQGKPGRAWSPRKVGRRRPGSANRVWSTDLLTVDSLTIR